MPDLDDDDEWEVEEVKGKQTFKGETRYLVKWAGWPSEYNQWVSEEDMANAKGKIRDFEQKSQQRAQRLTRR